MKYVNNFFVKCGYGIGTVFLVILELIFIFFFTYGKFLLVFYFIRESLDWPEMNAVQDLADKLQRYAYGFAAYMALIPKWLPGKKENEDVTLLEFFILIADKGIVDLDKWYTRNIRQA